MTYRRTQIYTGPEKVLPGMKFIVIDPMVDNARDADEYQQILHADQRATVRGMDWKKHLAQVETMDGAIFWLSISHLAIF